MIHTHLLEINKNLDKAFEDEQNGGKGSLFKKPKNDPICEYTDSVLNGCYACQREETRMNSYVYTFFYLWKTEPEFVDWFIKKFDYRFQDEPWKDSKDAVERAILKLSGVLDK